MEIAEISVLIDSSLFRVQAACSAKKSKGNSTIFGVSSYEVTASYNYHRIAERSPESRAQLAV